MLLLLIHCCCRCCCCARWCALLSVLRVQEAEKEARVRKAARAVRDVRAPRWCKLVLRRRQRTMPVLPRLRCPAATSGATTTRAPLPLRPRSCDGRASSRRSLYPPARPCVPAAARALDGSTGTRARVADAQPAAIAAVVKPALVSDGDSDYDSDSSAPTREKTAESGCVACIARVHARRCGGVHAAQEARARSRAPRARRPCPSARARATGGWPSAGGSQRARAHGCAELFD